MTILVVDNILERLNVLVECLRNIYPMAEIKAERDPYGAGKYCLFHPVDMVFSELEPGKMDGLQLKELVRHTNPNAEVYITGELQSLYDWEILDQDNKLLESDIKGALYYPVTPEKLGTVLAEKAGGGVQ